MLSLVVRRVAHALALLSAFAPATAQQASPTRAPRSPVHLALDSVADIDLLVRELITHGRAADALTLIGKLDPATQQAFEIRYLKAQALRANGKPRQALDIYNALLANNSTTVLIRLELAQTYVEIGEFLLAEQNFRLALADDIAPADATRVRSYLIALNRANGVRGSFEIALAPDSNVNAASGLRRINIGGLWFTLDDKAKKHRGVGLAVAGGIEARGEVDGLRYVASAYGRAREYSGRDYDDELVGVSLGPELVANASRFSLSGIFEHRRFGGLALYNASGMSLASHFAGRGEVAYDGAMLVQHYDYFNNRQAPSTLVGGELRRTDYISAQAFWLLRAGASRSTSAAPVAAYDAFNIGVGYYSTFPLETTVYVEPQIRLTRYNLDDPIFHTLRRDNLGSITIRLTKQNWSWQGFRPYLEVEQAYNQSNIPIQSFWRTGVRFGLRRSI